MREAFKTLVRRGLRSVGQVTIPFSQTYEANRLAGFRRRNIDLVVDVGANAGQYAKALRAAGYNGFIYSLEPLPDAYELLKDTMKGDIRWEGKQLAAGPETGTAPINISADSVCSSLLQPTSNLIDAIPSARVIKTINVEVVRLDDLELPTHMHAAVKMDVQGFEKKAMAGACSLLARAHFLEVELAIEPSYDGAYSFAEALPEIREMGFEIASIGRGYSDPLTGRMIDLDVLFERRLESV